MIFVYKIYTTLFFLLVYVDASLDNISHNESFN